MGGRVVGNLDLLGDGVPACDGREAGSESGIVNTLACAPAVGLEGVAREPVVAPACLALRAVWVVAAGLSRHVGTRESPGLKAVLCGLFLGVGGEVARGRELVHQGLVLADPVREHTAVVAVVVNTPLDVDNLTGRVGRNNRVTPVGARLIVVDAHAGVVATNTASAHRCSVQVGPRTDWLKNRALGARIETGLSAS